MGLPKSRKRSVDASQEIKSADYVGLHGVPLVKFSAEHWRTVQAAIRNDGCCEATVRVAGIVLRSILRFAVERKHLERLPELPPLPRKADTEIVTYTDEEVRKLLAACTCSRHRIAVLLICYAGLRTSEIRGLRGCDIDLHTRTLRVRQAITLGPKKPVGTSRLVKDKPKGRNERTIPLHEEAYPGGFGERGLYTTTQVLASSHHSPRVTCMSVAAGR